MLFEVFLIDMPKWYPDFVSSRIRTANSLPSYDDMSLTHRQQLTQLYPNRKRMNLVDQYQTFILVAFIDAGLIEVMMTTSPSIFVTCS
jgi:hypothetical protein